MRAGKNGSPDEIRERYLGEIAPLIEAARNIDSLTPAQKKQVRRRVLRTVFGGRSRLSRFRLTPVMVAVGLLVAGGVAFATAERLGLIHRSDQGPPNLKTSDGDSSKRKGHRSKRGTPNEATAQQPAAADLSVASGSGAPSTVPSPVIPPLQVAPTLSMPATPGARPEGLPSLARSRPTGIEAKRSPTESGTRSSPQKTRAVDAPMPGHPSVSPTLEAASLTARAPQPVRKLALATPYLAEPMSAPPRPVAADRQLAPVPAAPVAYPAPAPWPLSAASAPESGQRHDVRPATPAVAPAPLVPAPVATTVASDPALFGQALRKLRNDNDPAAALIALQQHARTYPRSSFSGERNALEVEALLALHRDREALQKLDGMSLENLPRSGERLVVRGELRAAARRWADAKEDFDRALSRVSGSPAWHERALWGRGVARLRCGEREAGMEDIERYHDIYPRGRFAAEASRFFPNP